METFIKWLEKNVIPFSDKLMNQRHLAAIRDGFIAIMPLMIVGAFAIMLNSVFLDFSDGSLIGTILSSPINPEDYPEVLIVIKDILSLVTDATLGLCSLVVAFTIASSLAEFKGYNGLEAAVISIVSFIIAIPLTIEVDPSLLATGTASVSGINPDFFSASNIITAILIANISTEIYTWFLKKNIVITMPEDVPPAVARSFVALLPSAVIFMIFAIFQVVLSDGIIPNLQFDSISAFIQATIALPLKQVGGGFIGMFLYLLLAPLLFFFGIHGPNTLAFIEQGIFVPASIQNGLLINDGIINAKGVIDQAAYSSLPLIEHATIYSKSLIVSYVALGGTGATLGLVFAILLASRDETTKKMGKYALMPALFNINEPLIFGLPIVLNPVLFIPFVLVQPILMITSVIAMNLNIIPLYGILVPWTTPVGLSAFLAYGGSISAFIFALFQLMIATIVYYPFVVAMNRTSKTN